MTKLRLVSRICLALIVLLVVADVLFAEIIKGDLFIAWAVLLGISVAGSIVIEIIIKRRKTNV